MITIGQKYKIVNHDYLNGIIVKVIDFDGIDNDYLCEIVDKSLLDDPKIKYYFHNNSYEYKNYWYHWIKEENLQSLRFNKLK